MTYFNYLTPAQEQFIEQVLADPTHTLNNWMQHNSLPQVEALTVRGVTTIRSYLTPQQIEFITQFAPLFSVNPDTLTAQDRALIQSWL